MATDMLSRECTTLLFFVSKQEDRVDINLSSDSFYLFPGFVQLGGCWCCVFLHDMDSLSDDKTSLTSESATTTIRGLSESIGL